MTVFVAPSWAQVRRSLAPLQRRLFSSTFREGDIVFLKRTDKPDAAPILTRPLKRDGKIQSHRGNFSHNDIIGKSPRQTVTSTAGRVSRLRFPALDDYVSLTPRLVTPVYGREANVIVSLLDVHASSLEFDSDARPLEILEAGTGHGSLTLHLARSIHAANSHIRPAKLTDETMAASSTIDGADSPARPRGAVVHTLDIVEANSLHARRIVRRFRRGLYANDVDFHVGSIPDFLNRQFSLRGSEAPFLSYAVLDLPEVDEQLVHVAKALHGDGTLAVFCPNVTQIIDCVKAVKTLGLPLHLEQTVELGSGVSGGKQWDLKLVKPRNASKPIMPDPLPNAIETDGEMPEPAAATALDGWELVCRPKYGDSITAGGFLGIWKKTIDN